MDAPKHPNGCSEVRSSAPTTTRPSQSSNDCVSGSARIAPGSSSSRVMCHKT
jgi:hypothetical protein